MKNNQQKTEKTELPVLWGLGGMLILSILLLEACVSTPAATPTVLPTYTSVQVSAPTTTPSSVPLTPTPTPIQHQLSVFTFHDWNANEVQDLGEPALEGVRINVANESCQTTSEGRCDFSVTERIITVCVDPSTAAIPELVYLFLDDVTTPGCSVRLDVQANMSVSIALGQGPLPVPIKLESVNPVPYNGFGEQVEGHYHGAYDFEVIGETPQTIYANISGTVQRLPDYTPEQPFGPFGLVILERPDLGFYVQMGHLTQVYVEPGQYVSKGTPVGEIDPTLYNGQNVVAGTTIPHLEYAIWGEVNASEWDWVDALDLSPKKGEFVFCDF